MAQSVETCSTFYPILSFVCDWFWENIHVVENIKGLCHRKIRAGQFPGSKNIIYIYIYIYALTLAIM